MLLDSEIRSGEIYVLDREFILDTDTKTPQLFQMVQEPQVIRSASLYGGLETSKANGIYENIATGELVNCGTRCFTTINRIKKQYANINSIFDKSRIEFVKEAFGVISAYEEGLDKT
jgi:hypothetical protein